MIEGSLHCSSSIMSGYIISSLSRLTRKPIVHLPLEEPAAGGTRERAVDFCLPILV
jgi:hypothetical protein